MCHVGLELDPATLRPCNCPPYQPKLHVILVPDSVTHLITPAPLPAMSTAAGAAFSAASFFNGFFGTGGLFSGAGGAANFNSMLAIGTGNVGVRTLQDLMTKATTTRHFELLVRGTGESSQPRTSPHSLSSDPPLPLRQKGATF